MRYNRSCFLHSASALVCSLMIILQSAQCNARAIVHGNVLINSRFFVNSDSSSTAYGTWIPVQSPPPALTSIVANSTGTVVVAGESGIFISLNTGASWSTLHSIPSGRLKVSASGDFYIFGAAVWRLHPALLRFEQIFPFLESSFLENDSLSRNSLLAGDFVHDLETVSSGTVLFLALQNKGLMRITVRLNATSASIVSGAHIITSASVSALAAHRSRSETIAVWSGTIWRSEDEGVSWQMISTSSSIVAFLDPSRAQRLHFGRTQYGVSSAITRNMAAPDSECGRTLSTGDTAISSRTLPFFPRCIDALWERDDYTLLATSSGELFAQSGNDMPALLTSAPLPPRTRIRQFAETGTTVSGTTIFVLTDNGGVYAAEELPRTKANPLGVPQRKALRWRECRIGLQGSVDKLFVLPHNVPQDTTVSQDTLYAAALAHLVLTRSSWLAALPDTLPDNFLSAERSDMRHIDARWTNIASDSLLVTQNIAQHIAQLPVRHIVHSIQTSDGALFAFAQRTRDAEEEVLRSLPTVSPLNSAQLFPTTAVFSLPRGLVWLRGSSNTVLQSNGNHHSTPIMLHIPSATTGGGNGVLILFARDTSQSRLAPTHRVFSSDEGRTWRVEEMRGLGESVALGSIQASPRGVLFGIDGVFARKTIYRSSDFGKTWRSLNIGRVAEALAMHPHSGMLVMPGSPLMLSADDGDTWISGGVGLPFRSNGRFEEKMEITFPIARDGQSIVLALRNLGVFYSTNGGAVFQASSPKILNIHSLRAAPNGDIFALANDAVWISIDTGRTWQKSNDGLEGVGVEFVAADVVFTKRSAAYLATTGGIYRKEARVQKEFISKPPTASLLTSLFTRSSVMLSPLSAHRNNALAVDTVRLHPNPASEESILEFRLLAPSLCVIDLINMRGEKQSRIQAGMLEAAHHSIILSLRHLPQGQYWCRISIGTHQHTIPLQVIR